MSFIVAEHFSKVPASAWRWPNFPVAEIACRGTGALKVSVDAMNKLQALRELVGAPMIINSAYRSPEHNARTKGASRNSKHLEGHAFDVSMANHDPEVFEAAALACGFTGFGFYPPKKGNFIHLDCGRRREWGTRWKAPKHQPEPKARMVSTPAKAGIVGLTTMAAATEAVTDAVSPENLAAVQAVVQPMIAYSDIFQAVFVACGVGIVGWTVYKRFWKRAP